MSNIKAKTIVLNEKFDRFPHDGNFKLVEEHLPAPRDGEFLAEAEFLSVDPWARVLSKEVGRPLIGQQVAKIIESKNSQYPVGEFVIGDFGWRTHTVIGGRFEPRLLKNRGDLPRSLALGVLGATGNAARFGFFDVCKPKPGHTVVVSAAAGAVGSTVGQLAKNHGCTVVGITGSDAKGRRLIDELNFDAYVNYKSGNFEKELAEATPDKVDCYFDNVGGEISTSVLNRMNKFGRVGICGAVSTYNEPKATAREVQTPVKIQHITMEGFLHTRWQGRWEEGIDENFKLIQEGKLKYLETVTDGFENTPKAFMGLLRGENFGKAVVKV